MFRRVYLDNSATTRIDAEVLETMMPYMTDTYGNASSIHYFGQQARSAVDRARHQVADLIKAKEGEIVFTSGGTESNNLALRGLCEMGREYGNHVIISNIEHPAVDEVCKDLESKGFEVSRVEVSEAGVVSVQDTRDQITDDTILVSVMAVNNEIGTIQPVAEIGDIVREYRSAGNHLWFHTDAVQAAGKIDIDVGLFGCDLLTLSSHKIHGPKGIGALYIRQGVRIKRQMSGGHQERERRGGTENVGQIVGFGKAAEMAGVERNESAKKILELREVFESRVVEKVSGAIVNGAAASRSPHISNITFEGIEGEGLLINLDMKGVAVSTGSACSSGSVDASPVILALNQPEAIARGAVRFSFGKFNARDDIDYVLSILPDAVQNLRKLSPGFERSAEA